VNCKHLVGAPGCGKTHRLLEYVESLISSGIGPTEIAFVSFTRAAIHEAKRRVSEQFGISGDDLRYFATLHSMAYRSLTLSRDSVVTWKKWGEFCKSVGLRYSSHDGIPDDDQLEPIGNEEGDVLRRFHDWRRSCELPIEEALKRFDPGVYDGWSRARAVWFTRVFEEWKDAEGLYDFCDFLIELASSGWIPPVRVLIVDESQDLSPIQQRIVTYWGEQIGHLLIAYDSDQTIFEFQGADPRWLLNLGGEREFLNQSYRVPQWPSKICQRIIRRNKIRYENSWQGTNEKGEVRFDADLDKTVRLCQSEGGTWYFLARNRFYLSSYVSVLMDAGVPFINLRGFSPKPTSAVTTAIRLARGEDVTLDDLRHFSDDTRATDWWTRGAKASLERASKDAPDSPINREGLTRLGALPILSEKVSSLETCLIPLKTEKDKKRFHLRIYKRLGMDGLTKDPQVIISTVHGVKGGEAQNVVLDPRMTRRTAQGFDERPEPERRVWYVGASRTQSRLFVLDPRNSAFYDEW
jgi:DNA helicase II / ATP-dependent DNA helicase PcrA